MYTANVKLNRFLESMAAIDQVLVSNSGKYFIKNKIPRSMTVHGNCRRSVKVGDSDMNIIFI